MVGTPVRPCENRGPPTSPGEKMASKTARTVPRTRSKPVPRDPDGPREPDASDPSGTGSALEAYRKKRHPQRTPEPFGDQVPTTTGQPRTGPLSFVVHKHAARNLHY